MYSNILAYKTQCKMCVITIASVKMTRTDCWGFSLIPTLIIQYRSTLIIRKATYTYVIHTCTFLWYTHRVSTRISQLNTSKRDNKQTALTSFITDHKNVGFVVCTMRKTAYASLYQNNCVCNGILDLLLLSLFMFGFFCTFHTRISKIIVGTRNG